MHFQATSAPIRRVELCEHPLFRRGYSALYKAIVQLNQPQASPSAIEKKKLFQQSLLQALAPLIPAPNQRNFHLFGLDATPMPRPFAKTLEDRTYAYRQRFDLEHMLRFGKQRLLMGSFQTPDVEHEENWVQLTLLAYVQLWAVRELVDSLPRPWEKYYHKKNHHSITPSLVQRDFYRIIRQIGTPAKTPKPRGFSAGRMPGNLREKRKRHPVIKKGKKIKSSSRWTA